MSYRYTLLTVHSEERKTWDFAKITCSHEIARKLGGISVRNQRAEIHGPSFAVETDRRPTHSTTEYVWHMDSELMHELLADTAHFRLCKC